MRRVTVFAVIVGLAWAINIGPCHAADGKQLFVERCGKCHGSGQVAPAFAATKYASIQWERFFRRNKHKRKKDINSLFSVDDLSKIQKYLMDHAADSDQPEAVGLR